MDRRQFLAGALTAASLSAASKKPNIVYIMLDDEGTFDFGCYGQKKIQTPNADRLAAEGMKFTNAYSGAAVCAPARAVLMTGLHGGHAPVRANAGTIPITAGDVTIASVLKKAGYATGGFGKWGLGDAGTAGVPWQHGFDEFVGYLHQVHAHFYYPEFLWDNDRKLELPGNKNGAHGQYSADLIAERGLEFVRKHKDGPFFLYATGTLPHGNYEVPDFGPYADRNWPEKYKIYAAMCTRADTHIGRLLALLKELKLEDNTVVILTSDNGAPGGEDHGYDFFRSNGDLRGTKGTVYEGGIRVPFLVRWPGRVKPGSVSQYPIAFCDIMPTLAEIADARPPSGIDGLSIVPELTGGKQPKREFLYWEHNVYDQKTQKLREDRLLQAVRHGEWKGVRTKPGAPLELYNLRSDPSEQNNVAAEHPDVVATIEAYLKTARTTPRPHNTGSMKWVS